MVLQTQKPGAAVEETVVFTTETHLGYNASGDLIKMRKYTGRGGKYERDIFDEDITDRTISKWVKYTRWRDIR